MLGGRSITLFHVRGIRIAVDWSWFLVLFLVILWLSSFYSDVLGESSYDTEPFALAVLSALGFFGSIVLHELGHAFAAVRNGIGISSIQLWIFGGMARMDRESDTPATEFKVAAAGPAVTLAIVLVLAAICIAAAGWHDFREAALVDSDAQICCRPSRWTEGGSPWRSPGGGRATAPRRPASPPPSAASSPTCSSGSAC